MATLNHPLTNLLEKAGLFFLLAMPFLMFFGIAACDLAISAMAVLLLLRSSVAQDFSWLRLRWLQIALVLWLYMIILSFYAAVSVKASLSQAIPFGRFILFAASLQCWLLVSADYRRYMLYALTAALVLMTVNTLFVFLTGLSLLGKSAVQYQHYHHIVWFWHRPYGRLMGLNGKLSAGMMMVWVAMPVFAFLAATMKSSKAGFCMLALIALLLMMTAISITGDRMAFLECAFGYCLLFLLLPDLRKYFIVPAAILVVLLAVVFLYDPGLYHRNVALIFADTTHFSHDAYGDIFKTALAIFAHHPVFGVGLKQYNNLSASALYSYLGGHNTHAQNMYLEWMTGTGLVGTLLFLSMLFCWLKQFIKARALIYGAPIAAGVLVAFLLRAWPLASTTSFFFSWGAITFWWMGAWLLAVTDF